MNKKQRVLDCIDGKSIDKIPCSFWHHYSGADAIGRQCIEKHKQLYKETNIDFIKMMCDGYFGDIIPFEAKIERPSDWDRIKIPSLKSKFVEEQLDRVKGMVEAVNDECCVYYVLFSAFTYIMHYYGLEFCMDQLADEEANPYFSRALINMTEFIGEFGKRLIFEAGATGIHQAIGFNYLFSVEQYRKYMTPNDKYLMHAFKEAGDYNIVHLCGWEGFKNNLESWKDYGSAVTHWDQHTDKLSIPDGKKYFKNTRAYMTGFENKSNSILYHGTEQEVKAKAKEYAKLGGKTGFILSADCSIDSEIAYERLRWVTEAMDELGTCW